MERTLISQLSGRKNSDAYLAGHVTNIRAFKQFRFLFLQDRTDTAQVVLPNEIYNKPLGQEDVVGVIGTVVEQPKSRYGGLEVLAKNVEVLSSGEVGFSMQDKHSSIDTMLNQRAASLKLAANQYIFTTQSELIRQLSFALHRNGFTEVKTPKIVASGTEGGASLFKVDYFGSPAFLSQSPQLYHQMLMTAFERVFEVGPCFRAENYATSRHVNEFTSLDAELGFIRNEQEVMDILESLFKGLTIIPSTDTTFPRMNYDEAIKISNLGVGGRLSGEDKRALGEIAKQKHDSDFLFVYGFPNETANFYIMPGENGRTRSFKLIYRGQEISTGGQRIHDYKQLVSNMQQRGIDSSRFQSYLDAFKCGIPPHGGFCIGLNRLTALLANSDNVKKGVLFPRDPKRLTP